MNNNLVFNKEQEQILLGSLLGDGCINLSKTNYFRYRYSEKHSFKQEAYLLWKNSYLNFKLDYNNEECRIRKSNLSFKYYKELFYPTGKKIVTRGILNKLELLGLAIWYCDDGSYNYKGKSIEISTQSFGLNGNKIIQRWFKEKWRINSKITIKRFKKKETFISGIKIKNHKSFYYYLRFNVENTKKFIELIKPYVMQIPSMIYKIGLDEVRRTNAINKSKKTRREYQIKNQLKIKKQRKRRYLKNKKKINKKCREYYLKNRNIVLQKRREIYKQNKYAF